MWSAAFRRLTGLLVLAGGTTLLISLAFGLLIGESVSRAVSVGFYLVGSFLTIAGFFVGNRGPVRLEEGRRGAPHGLEIRALGDARRA